MKKIFCLLSVSLFLTGCATNTAIFELYSETPIEVDCARKAISSIGGVLSAEKGELEIKFEGKSYVGKLFYGGGNQFTTYGIELSTTPLTGPNLEKVSSYIAERINEQCSK